MCKNFFYPFLHFKILNLNHLSKNKIEPIEPKSDFSNILTQIFPSFFKEKSSTMELYWKENPPNFDYFYRFL